MVHSHSDVSRQFPPPRPQSLHRYNYAYGNPANLNDPSGNNPTLAGTMIQIAQSLYSSELAGEEAENNAVMWYRRNNPGAGAEEIARVGRLAYGMAFSTTLTDGVLDLLPGYAVGRAYYELGDSWDRFTDPRVDRHERFQAGISIFQNAASIGIQVASYASLFRAPIAKAVQASSRFPSAAKDVSVSWNPLTGSGPLGEKIAATFRSSTYTESITQSETILYRAYSDPSKQLGAYWTRTPPSGPVQSIIDSALNPTWGNRATIMTTIRVPPGQKIFEGIAAPQGGLVGGGNQIFLPTVNPSWVIQ